MLLSTFSAAWSAIGENKLDYFFDLSKLKDASNQEFT